MSEARGPSMMRVVSLTNTRTRRVLRALSTSAAPRVAAGLGLLLALPALGVGFFNDDFGQFLMREGAYPFSASGPWQAYAFTPPGRGADTLIEHGYLPWFTDPALHFRFLRPLSSLSLAADDWAFGRSPLAGHLHSFGWYAILLALVAFLHRRVLRPAEATVATLVYAVAIGPSQALAWVAARHALMGAALGVGAITLHVASRQRGRAAWGAPLFLAVGLLCSESALAAVPFIVLYELIVTEDGARGRLAWAIPSLLVAAGHLTAYGSLGFGVRHGGGYISPFHEPVAYAEAALSRGPALLAEAFGAVPSALFAIAEPARPVLVAWGAMTTFAVLGLLFGVRHQLRRRERRRALWLLLSLAGAIVPMLGGFLGGRLLLVAGVGASALLGVVIVQTLLSPIAGRGRRVLLAALLFLHLGFAPLVRLGLTAACDGISDAERDLAASLDPSPCAEGTHLLLVEGADPALSMFFEPALRFHAPQTAEHFASAQALSMVPSPHRLERTADGALILRVLDEPRPSSPFEAVYRSRAFEVGDVVRAGALSVRILEVERGLWRAAEITVEGGLDQACIGRWDGTRVVVGAPPSAGVSEVIPTYPGPTG
ncbi:MAG: hypothetical protein AB8I08_04980 [Sandaracinaceae bacterium]